VDLNIKIQNYKIIKSVSLSVPDGYTLIRGQSDNGKSSFFSAIRSFISNISSVENIQHGTNSFGVDINGVVYGRDNQGSFYKIGNNLIRKLNKSPLQDIEDFPLKFFKINDDTFYPNFVFQYEVPIFGQMEVYSFFSSLYKSLDVINQKFIDCKKDKADSTESVNKLSVEINYVRGLLLKDEEELKKYDIPKLKQIVSYADKFDVCINDENEVLSELEKTKQEMKIYDIYVPFLEMDLNWLEKKYKQFSLDLDDKRKYNGLLLSLKDVIGQESVVNFSVERLKVIPGIKEKVSKKIQYEQLLSDKISWEERDKKIQSVIPGVKGVVKLESSLKKKFDYENNQKMLSRYTEVSINLSYSINGIRRANRFRVFSSLTGMLMLLESDISIVSKSIKDIKDELALFNICPFCGQEIKEKEGGFTVDKNLIMKIEGLLSKLPELEKQLVDIKAKKALIEEKLKEFDPAEMEAIDEAIILKEIQDVEKSLEGVA
jgi:hypothetical protein